MSDDERMRDLERRARAGTDPEAERDLRAAQAAVGGALPRVDLIDQRGNICEHVVREDGATTLCGRELRQTQAAAGNRPCKNCLRQLERRVAGAGPKKPAKRLYKVNLVSRETVLVWAVDRHTAGREAHWRMDPGTKIRFEPQKVTEVTDPEVKARFKGRNGDDK